MFSFKILFRFHLCTWRLLTPVCWIGWPCLVGRPVWLFTYQNGRGERANANKHPLTCRSGACVTSLWERAGPGDEMKAKAESNRVQWSKCMWNSRVALVFPMESGSPPARPRTRKFSREAPGQCKLDRYRANHSGPLYQTAGPLPGRKHDPPHHTSRHVTSRRFIQLSSFRMLTTFNQPMNESIPYLAHRTAQNEAQPKKKQKRKKETGLLWSLVMKSTGQLDNISKSWEDTCSAQCAHVWYLNVCFCRRHCV